MTDGGVGLARADGTPGAAPTRLILISAPARGGCCGHASRHSLHLPEVYYVQGVATGIELGIRWTEYHVPVYCQAADERLHQTLWGHHDHLLPGFRRYPRGCGLCEVAEQGHEGAAHVAEAL
jgi:hypothetical protein